MKRIPRFLFLLMIGVLSTYSSSAQPVTRRQVLVWQDQRRGVDSLIVALRKGDPLVRVAAAQALGNVQDSAAAPALVEQLHVPLPALRRMSAFALGQMPCEAGEEGLRSAIPAEKDEATLRSMCDALGRCGGIASLDSVSAGIRSGHVSPAAGVQALMRFAVRGVRTIAGLQEEVALLLDREPEVRWRAAYACWRSAPNNLIDILLAKDRGLLPRLAKDPSAEVRAEVAVLLGRTAVPGSRELLEEMVRDESVRPDGDWRVMVGTARSVVRRLSAERGLDEVALGLLTSPRTHVVIATLQALEAAPATLREDSSFSAPAVRMLKGRLSGLPPAEVQVRAEIEVLLGRLNALDTARVAVMLRSPAVSDWMKTKLLEACGQVPGLPNLRLLSDALDHDTTRIAAAAWDYLHRIWTVPFLEVLSGNAALWKSTRARVVNAAGAGMERRDMALSTNIAALFGDTLTFRWFMREGMDARIRSMLCASLRRMSSAVDVEAMQAIIGTLGLIGDSTCIPVLEHSLLDGDRSVATGSAASLRRLTGRGARVPPQALPLHTEYDWDLLDSVRRAPTVTIETARGMIELELLPDDAPFTVLSMVHLVRTRFFDGLTIHRVVPDFVVQGGDPRGDGWGGPGYTIRTEVSPREYERGSVGVASAGKDTEGCQFFFTHTATPHLDGRYTIFARVRKGMEAVDRLQIGDRIISVRAAF